MREALAEAEKGALLEEVPVGALVVAPAGEIIARAHNQPISLNDPAGHAEILALRQAGALVANYRLPGHVLYVTLEPCPMCAGALLLARVKRLVFGTFDPKAGACGSLCNLVEDSRMNHRLEVTFGILQEECGNLLSAFFLKLRESEI